MFAKIKSITNDVVVEMKKVSWPTRVQLTESTKIVISGSLIITGLVFVIDQITTFVYSFIF